MPVHVSVIQKCFVYPRKSDAGVEEAGNKTVFQSLSHSSSGVESTRKSSCAKEQAFGRPTPSSAISEVC